MPVSDLFASSRRILRQLLGRSRRAAWVAAIVPLGSIGATSASAAPSVAVPAGFPSSLFSLRVTDIERVPGDLEGDAFRIELEVLNWSTYYAAALTMAANVGTSAVEGSAPRIAGASIDPDGRGGSAGGADIGPGVFDAVPIHSGYGRGDQPGRINDWTVERTTSTFVQWDMYPTGVVGGGPTGDGLRLDEQSVFYAFGGSPINYVPGFGVDALGDTAIDGGPGPYSPASPGGGPPTSPQQNIRDGFVLDVDDWDEGEVFSVNWFFANVMNSSGGALVDFYYRGEYGDDPFSLGVMSLVRIAPSIGAPTGNLPGPVFVDGVGFDQSTFSFYDTVYEIPNPAEFAAEFGGAITAPFLNPADNVFNVSITTALIPEPSGAILIVGAAACCSLLSRRFIVCR